MKLPLDMNTVSRALRLAEELFTRGGKSEGSFIAGEVFAALADSKWLDNLLEELVLPLLSGAQRRITSLLARSGAPK